MRLIVLLSFFIMFSYSLQAQQVNQMYEFILRDGSVIKGKIVDINKSFWTIETKEIGSIQLPFEKVVSFKALEETDVPWIKSQIQTDSINPIPHRYLFTPSAFNLEKGNISFSNSWLFFNSIDYGILHNWSVGTGGFFIYLFPVAISVHSKFSFNITPRTRFAIQADYITSTLANTGIQGFTAQGLITFGNRRKNLTFNLGRFLDKNFNSTNGILAGFSHTSPIGRRTFFITQNQFLLFDDSSQLINPSLCFRLVRGKKSYDLGLMGLGFKGSNNTYDFIPFPYIGYQFNFNRRK